MSISSDAIRKAGPFKGNGVTTVFPFTFKVFAASDLLVVRTDPNNVSTTLVLTTDYTVQLNTNQDTTPGGTVTLNTAPPTGYTLVVGSVMAALQSLVLTNTGGFYPSSLNDAFDRAVILIQQLAERVGRTLQFSIADKATAFATLPNATARANTIQAYDALGYPTLVTMPASVGAGDIRADTFTAGVDFTPGVTTQLTPSRDPGVAANVEIFFDTAFQGPDQWALNTGKIVFNSAIPVGVSKVFIRSGSTLSTTVPPTASVTVQKLAADVLSYLTAPSLKTYGATGNGTADDSPAFAAADAAAPGIVIVSQGTFRVSTNTTVHSDLLFEGGVITVDAGVTLTLQGAVIAPSRIIFKGAGVVNISDGIIDVTWYDGADGTAKWNFARRGLSNTGHHVFMFPQVGPQDPHAINTNMGWAWSLSAPLLLDNTAAAGDGDSIITILTYGAFAASTNIAAVWYIGHNTSKTDVVEFPIGLKVYDLVTNRIASAFRVEGGGHHNIASISAWGCGNVLWLNPQGSNQVNDFKVGSIYCAGLTDRAVKLDATAGANNSITDCQIGFINCDGFIQAAAVDCLVHIQGAVTGVKIPKVTLRGIQTVAGYVDATTAVVLIENTSSAPLQAPGFLVEIDSILDGSQPATAKCLVVRDASGGAGPHTTGVCLTNGVQGSVQPAISLSWCNGAQIVPGYLMQALIAADCTGTLVSQALPSQVTDNGVNTLINGHNYRPASAATVGSSPVSYTNSAPYDIDYQIQGGTVTSVTITRNGTTVTVYSGASLNAGMFRLSPGDQITYSYSAAPTANIIPR